MARTVLMGKTARMASLLMSLLAIGGTLCGYCYGVVTNGTRHNTDITVNGGTLTSTDANDGTSIYHSNRGKLTINGGKFIGYDGLAVKGGTPVTITGGEFVATGEQKVPTAAASSGCNSVGSALYVEGNYGYGAQVVISGGTFTTADPEAPAILSMFNTTTEATISITGGTFSTDPSEYVADEYKATANGNGTWTVNFGVAQIVETGVKYGSLADAITAATTGQTIKMLCDTKYGDNGIRLENVNLDLNNFKMRFTRTSSDASARSFNLFGNVTISKGSIECSFSNENWGAIYANQKSEVTLNDVNIKAYKTSDPTVPAYGAAVFGGYLDNPNGGMVINGGVFESKVTTNGSTRGGCLTINGGTFKENLYLPAYMDYVITGGTFEKKVEFRSGVIRISGGDFQNSGTPACPNPALQDPIIVGCSVGLVAHGGPLDNSQDSGYGPTPELTITGGTFAGKIGLYRKNAEYAYPTVTATGVTVATVELGAN